MNLKRITNSIRNKHYNSPSELQNIIFSIKEYLIIPSVTMDKGSSIFRASRITNIDEVKDIKRLSYKPADKNESYGRASVPKKTMFYGIRASSYINALASGIFEICPCMKVANSSPEHHMIVLSRWTLKKSLILASLINIDGQNKSNTFNTFQAGEYSSIANMLPNGTDVKDFWRLMNGEYTKHVFVADEYMVSAYFADFIMSLNTFDGIIYESVQSTDPNLKESLCVAFSPIIADDYLEFEKADLWEFDITEEHTATSAIMTKSNIISK